MYKNDKEHIFMELQLGKQKRMMYARVFDRTEEETCSVDAVVQIGRASCRERV